MTHPPATTLPRPIQPSRRHPVAALRAAAAGAVEALEPRAYLTVAFGSPIPFGVTPNENGNLEAPVIADFDRDGKADIIVVDAFNIQSATRPPTNGMLAFAKGAGNGTFQLNTAFSGGVFTSQAKAGDFDGDNKLDLVVANAFGNNINVLRGNGDGTFQAPVSFTVGTEPQALAVADFNGDGRADVAVGNRLDGTVSVLLGAASGLLGAPSTITTGTDPASIVAGDFDGDLKIDLVVGNSGDKGAGQTPDPGSLTFLAGSGTGTFAAGVNTAGPRGITATGDFNGDGKLDVAVSVTTDGVPSILLSNGDGTFAAGSVPPAGQRAIVSDFDGDGKADVAYGLTSASPAVTAVRVAPGNGDGTFAPVLSFPADQPGAGTAGDVNGDGRADLVVTGLSDSGRLLDVLINQSGSAGGQGPDITATLLGKLPAAVVGGTTKGKVSVKVTNNGNALLNAPVKVSLFASADAVADIGTDPQMVTVTKKLKLKPGKSKTLKLSFKYAGTLPDGQYNLLAVADPDNTVPEGNDGNNTAVSPAKVTIAAPFIEIGGAFASALPASLPVGKKQTVAVKVTNTGNITGKGPLSITLVASADGTADAGDVTLRALATKVSLKPGKSKTIKLSYVVPQLTGSLSLIASLQPSGTLTDRDLANNVIVSASPIPAA